MLFIALFLDPELHSMLFTVPDPLCARKSRNSFTSVRTLFLFNFFLLHNIINLGGIVL